MKRNLAFAALLLASALPLKADDWSIGVATGPFVFGDFVRRTLRPATPEGSPSGTQTMVLSAATRAGLAVDVERAFAPRWAVRVEGTFTRAPLSVKDEHDDDGTSIDAGDVDISTFTLPLVFRINPSGSFRFHILGGPAYAMYRIQGRPNASGISPFDESRGGWGATAGGGVAWWMSDRFSVEGRISDTYTSSPFKREDFPPVPGFKIPKPHNVHTTVGVRWRF